MIEFVLIFLGSFLYFGYLSAESGASLPWSGWQNSFKISLRQLPEIIIAISVAAIAVYFRNLEVPLPLNVNTYDFVTYALLAYAGKQAATWAMLSNNFIKGYKKDDNQDGVVDYNDGRKSKIKNVVDDIADSLDVPITSPKYAWVWSGFKGFIMTWPLGGLGAPGHTFGHWLAVKLFYNKDGSGKVKYPNAYKEWIGGGLCFATAICGAYAYFKYL